MYIYLYYRYDGCCSSSRIASANSDIPYNTKNKQIRFIHVFYVRFIMTVCINKKNTHYQGKPRMAIFPQTYFCIWNYIHFFIFIPRRNSWVEKCTTIRTTYEIRLCTMDQDDNHSRCVWFTEHTTDNAKCRQNSFPCRWQRGLKTILRNIMEHMLRWLWCTRYFCETFRSDFIVPVNDLPTSSPDLVHRRSYTETFKIRVGRGRLNWKIYIPGNPCLLRFAEEIETSGKHLPGPRLPATRWNTKLECTDSGGRRWLPTRIPGPV